MTVHYHGTPITGGGDDGGPSNQVLIEQMAGAHFCVSFAAPSQVKLCHDIADLADRLTDDLLKRHSGERA